MNVSKKDILYALGGLIKRYENGGVRPDGTRKSTLAEREALKAKAREAFEGFDKNATGEPLTKEQLDIVFNQWPDDARKLGESLLDAGIISRRSLVATSRNGNPLHLPSFNKFVLKGGDARNQKDPRNPDDYNLGNVKTEFRTLFKKDGDYELKDVHSKDVVKNELREFASNAGLTDRPKLVNTTAFTMGSYPPEYYGEAPERETPLLVEDIPEEEEETPPEDLDPVTPVQAKPTPVVRKRIEPEEEPEEEVIEEDDDVQVVVRKKLPASGINLGSDLPRSDRLGTGDLPTQSEMGLYGENIRPVEGGIKLIKKPTNEKGGRLYDKGGKMPKALLAYFMKKQKQNMAGGGLFRVMKR